MAVFAPVQGTWITWTSTFTNFSGTVDNGYYCQLGKTVFYRLNINVTGAATGILQFSLPVTASANETTSTTFGLNHIGMGNALQHGVNRYDLTVVLASSTTAQLYALAASGAYTNPTATSGTVPFTWSNTDGIFVRGFYEAA